MLHTTFQGNRSTGSEDFWSVFIIYGHGDHLVHVTKLMKIKFSFFPPTKLAYENWLNLTVWFPQKNALWLWNLIDLGPRSKNNFDLLYSCGFTESFSWLLPPTLASLTAIISEDALFSLFPIEKTKCLTMKKVKVMPGSSFKSTIMSPSPQYYIPKFKVIDPLVLKKSIEGFYLIWAWRQFWPCVQPNKSN